MEHTSKDIGIHYKKNSKWRKNSFVTNYYYTRPCGLGTKLDKRKSKGNRGMNLSDDFCKDHDIDYSQSIFFWENT